MNDERHAADTLYQLGTVAWSTGLNDEAIRFHEQAVEICERTGFADLVAVQATLEQTRRTSKRHLTLRCIDALAEIALAAGDASRCRAYGDELLVIAQPNGQRKIEAGARRWRGEALLAQKAHVQAQAELSRAAALASDIGRVRLQMDAQAALARPYGAQGQSDAARRHGTKAHAIARGIEKSLVSSGLDARLRMTGEWQ